MYSIGQIRVDDASYLLVEGEQDGQYSCFVFRDSHLVGAILLGNTTLSAAVKQAIEQRMDCSTILKPHPRAGEVVDFLGEVTLKSSARETQTPPASPGSRAA